MAESQIAGGAAWAKVENSRQLGDVLERTGEAVAAFDRKWHVTYINAQAASLIGRRPEQVIGKDIWAVVPEAASHPVRQMYEEAMAGQVFVKKEYFGYSNRWFSARMYPGPDGMAVYLEDITTRKEAEQAAARGAALLKAQNEVLERIAQGAPLQETLDLLARVVEAQYSEMLCSILLLDSDGVHVRHGAGPSLPETYRRGVDGQPIGPCAGSCGTAAYRRQAVIVEDIASDPLWVNYRELALSHGLRACWSTPIQDAHGGVLGTFALYFRTPRGPTQEHYKLIEMSTHVAGIAIVRHRETETLRQSEERLRIAVTGGNIGIWEWHTRTGAVIWNDQLKEIFGVPSGASLTVQTFLQAIHPDDRDRVAAVIQRSLQDRSDFGAEFRIVRPDGSIRWIAGKGVAEYAGGSTPLRVIGTSLDITQRKRSEEEIQRRQAQLAEAQRIARLGSFEWDVRENKWHRSDELCRILGAQPGELEPTLEAYLARVHPDDRSRSRRIIEQAIENRTAFDLEERIVWPDGTVRQLRTQSRWILDDSHNPVKMVGVRQDITERKQAEDQLRASEERFQLVAKATNDAIWDWDMTSNTLWWNAGLKSFGYAEVEIGAEINWWYERIHPEDFDRVISSLKAATHSQGHFWSSEYRFRRADGSYADVFDRGYVLYDQAGSAVRMIGALADITGRKRALETLEERVAARTAELQAKNEELEYEIRERRRAETSLRAKNEESKAFSYMVSHDLKAPVRGIAGYAEELDRRHSAMLDDRARFCLAQIRTGVVNLDHLIEDLLRYSQIDSEVPTQIEIDLANMVASILEQRRNVIAEHGTEVVVNLAPAPVRAWERGLFQVLTNLIDNALKFSRAARPPRVEIRSVELPGTYRITVSDNGIGFDLQYHDRIFGLFNRLVRQEEFEGTGAGLAIARKLLERQGGAVWAESAPGCGAAFYVDLPIGTMEGALEGA